MRFATRVLALLVALLVLGGSAWGGEHYLCRMSGRVQSSCCCGAARANVGKSAQPGVRSEDCCERVAPGERTVVTTARAGVQPSELAVLVGVVPEPQYLPPLPPAREVGVRPARGPPAPKQPLYAVHCAYLC